VVYWIWSVILISLKQKIFQIRLWNYLSVKDK